MARPLTQAKEPALDEDIAFSDYRGARKPRIEKRQRKLLAKLGVVGDFLDADERVLLATHALSPTPFLEQLTTGAVFVFIKRCLLVFTNKRILHFPTSAGYRYRQSVAQMCYSDIRQIRIKGAVLNIDFSNGRREKFLYIARRERRKIKTLVPDLPVAAGTPTGQTRVHLCPRCKAMQATNQYQCPGCRLEFKSKKTATRLSWLLPGGGYFYTGHWLLGISDAAVELLLLAALALSVMDWAGGNDESFAIVVIFAIFLIVEKTVTIYHARCFVDEYMPKDRMIKPVGPIG